MKFLAVALAVASLSQAACSKATPDVESAAREAKCTTVELSKTPNMFNAHSAKCSDGGRVYWFPTPEAQKNHGEICKQVGGLKKETGSHWTKYLPSC